MKEMLMRSSHTIQIWTLGGHVLSDWDEYCTAVEESLPTLIQEYIGEDPAAFACMKHFMGSVSTKAKARCEWFWHTPGQSKAGPKTL